MPSVHLTCCLCTYVDPKPIKRREEAKDKHAEGIATTGHNGAAPKQKKRKKKRKREDGAALPLARGVPAPLHSTLTLEISCETGLYVYYRDELRKAVHAATTQTPPQLPLWITQESDTAPVIDDKYL